MARREIKKQYRENETLRYNYQPFAASSSREGKEKKNKEKKPTKILIGITAFNLTTHFFNYQNNCFIHKMSFHKEGHFLLFLLFICATYSRHNSPSLKGEGLHLGKQATCVSPF